jgi:hypothetical protein
MLEILGSARGREGKFVEDIIRKNGLVGRTECCTIYAAVP